MGEDVIDSGSANILEDCKNKTIKEARNRVAKKYI